MEFKATHCSFTTPDKAQKMIDAAVETGLEYMIVPYTPDNVRKNADGWKKVAEDYNKMGVMCKKAGIKFGYHNHAFEFEELDGIIPQELLIESTDADLVHFEADLFWITQGGYDPAKLLKKYPGRIQLFHVKDATSDLEETTVGKGIIDFENLFKTGRKDALEYYFVEDEREDDPFSHIKADYDYMANQAFAK
jgi:sugar phosphate isomerase/epimerase